MIELGAADEAEAHWGPIWGSSARSCWDNERRRSSISWITYTSTQPDDLEIGADWQRRVVGRSLKTATERSVDRGRNLIRAASVVLERSNGEDITVQEVADEAGQSLRTLYQYFASKDDLLLALFEEATRKYATLIERAIADLTDPLDRLAGAIVAALRMPEVGGSGVDRGLVRLRHRLSEANPEMVARAQSALAAIIREVIEAAAAAGRIQIDDADEATFMILSMNTAFITSETFGDEAGARRPDQATAALFSLRGLGATLDDGWFERIDHQLKLPAPNRRKRPPAKRR